MHSKLNIAHEFLQDITIENMLSLNEIADDFTAPPATNDLDTLASLLGVVFYFMVSIQPIPPLHTPANFT
jgi:hypothetical protein